MNIVSPETERQADALYRAGETLDGLLKAVKTAGRQLDDLAKDPQWHNFADWAGSLIDLIKSQTLSAIRNVDAAVDHFEHKDAP